MPPTTRLSLKKPLGSPSATTNRQKPKLELTLKPKSEGFTPTRRRNERVIEQSFSRKRSIDDLVDDDTRAFARARLPWQRPQEE